jgi:hypothetical protein
LNMWDEAIRDDLAVHSRVVRKQGPESLLSIMTLSDAGLSQCRAGRYAEGGSSAFKAFEGARQAFGARAGITGGASYAFAICLIGSNRLEEASDLLQNIDVSAVTQLTGDSSVGASVALAEAEIAVRQGDYTLGKRYLLEAAPLDQPDANIRDRQTLQKLRDAINSHSRASM